MVESWEKNEAEDERYTPNLLNSLMSLTMHTVAGAAYGIPMSFSGGESVERPGRGKDLFTDGATPPTGFTYTFRQALSFIAGDIIRHVLITTRLPSWLPIPFLRPYQRAHKDFTGYLHALTTRAGTSGRNTLLDLLVSADGLSSEELTGNLFIFTLAGQETTAQTLNFAFLMLALNPEAQEWVFANVDAVLKDQPRNTSEWKYPEVFPRLLAPLCLMVGPPHSPSTISTDL